MSKVATMAVQSSTDTYEEEEEAGWNNMGRVMEFDCEPPKCIYNRYLFIKSNLIGDDKRAENSLLELYPSSM